MFPVGQFSSWIKLLMMIHVCHACGFYTSVLTWELTVNHSLYEFFQVSHKTCEDLHESKDKSEEAAVNVVEKPPSKNISNHFALRGKINFCGCNIKMVLCTVSTTWKWISTIVILQDARASEPQTYNTFQKPIIIEPQRHMSWSHLVQRCLLDFTNEC